MIEERESALLRRGRVLRRPATADQFRLSHAVTSKVRDVDANLLVEL